MTGEVEWQHQRANIERNIEQVGGVANVISLITIKPRLTGSDVKKHSREALERHAEIEDLEDHREEVNGTVTLSGTVDSLAEMDRVENAAWSAPPVFRSS